jgi:predicted GNAT superfamily acetyltransferase
VAEGFAQRLAQRERALADGLELLGWTFDPLDVEAAALSVARLGAVVEQYVADQDRLLAYWWIRRPHVERRIATAGKLVLRAQDAAAAPVITSWPAPEPAGRRLWVEFAAKINAADGEPSRTFLRQVLTHHFALGYRIVDFAADQPRGVARYLLARPAE